MKKYNVEIVYQFEGEIFRSIIKDVTHATIFRTSGRETLEIESLVKNKTNVKFYHSFISEDNKYDILQASNVLSVHFY